MTDIIAPRILLFLRWFCDRQILRYRDFLGCIQRFLNHWAPKTVVLLLCILANHFFQNLTSAVNLVFANSEPEKHWMMYNCVIATVLFLSYDAWLCVEFHGVVYYDVIPCDSQYSLNAGTVTMPLWSSICGPFTGIASTRCNSPVKQWSRPSVCLPVCPSPHSHYCTAWM